MTLKRCQTCDGTGDSEHTPLRLCNHCYGTGIFYDAEQLEPDDEAIQPDDEERF